MSTESASNLFAARLQQFKQTREQYQGERLSDVPVYTPKAAEPPRIIVRPVSANWEELEKKLAKVINFEGVWRRARDLYEQGYGAELETMAGIAIERANQMPPTHYFARSIGKKMGLWKTRTLKTIQETWEVRRNALRVIEKLNLAAESTKAVLATAWRLKGGIVRILELATEQGVGIKNQVGFIPST